MQRPDPRPDPRPDSRPDSRPDPQLEPAVSAAIGSPVGPIHAAAVAAGIVGLEVCSTAEAFGAGLRRRTGREVVRRGPDADPAAVRHLDSLEGALAAHFAGAVGAVEAADLPLVLEGISAWDRRVLEGVRGIGPGETAGYGEVARRIGAPGAARAVGSAVGRNPIGFVIPCHRVIAGDGTLGGYGGSWPGDREALLALKEELLALEGVHLPRRQPRY